MRVHGMRANNEVGACRREPDEHVSDESVVARCGTRLGRQRRLRNGDALEFRLSNTSSRTGFDENEGSNCSPNRRRNEVARYTAAGHFTHHEPRARQTTNGDWLTRLTADESERQFLEHGRQQPSRPIVLDCPLRHRAPEHLPGGNVEEVVDSAIHP